MESCEELNLDSLNDSDYVKHGFCLWINNEPTEAIKFLEKRKDCLVTEYGSILLHFFNALISFDRNKINEVSTLLRELEKKCNPEQSWLKSIKTKLFGQRDYVSRKSILIELEREIILADILLCSSILIGISCDVSSYIKAALILRRAWKIYNQIFKEIHDLCTQNFSDGTQSDVGSFDIPLFNNNNDNPPSPTSSECSNWTVPINHNVPHIPQNITKSHSTFFSPQKDSKLKKLSKHVAMMSFQAKSESSDCDISLDEFRKELNRLRGAIYFGYGLLQIAFSFIPPQLKVINFLGYQGDRETGLNYLKEAKNSQDLRSLMSIIALLYYYLIIVPFFALENSELSSETLQTATEILNENERFDQSALFLFFSGRRQRLKKKMKFAIMHYDAALRVPNLPRELKMLVMHELGLCLLIELNFHDAMHYFNELKVSKFSKSYYIYLTSICCGAIDSSHESLKFVKERLQKNISVSSQKDGIIERFLTNRCNFSIPDEERDPIFWKLLCYEIMYLWNLLGSCSQQTIQVMIEDCKSAEEKSEPILGISNFLMAACFSLQNDYENAIISYKKCIESYNENPSNLTYVPAYANYELAVILIKHVNDDNKEEIQKLLENAQSWKNFDFEHRLRLKVHNVKIN